jgi:hypothetical protein
MEEALDSDPSPNKLLPVDDVTIVSTGQAARAPLFVAPRELVVQPGPTFFAIVSLPHTFVDLDFGRNLFVSQLGSSLLVPHAMRSGVDLFPIEDDLDVFLLKDRRVPIT